MLKEKKMWMILTDHVHEEAVEKGVLYDGKTRKVEFVYDDGSSVPCLPDANMQFFAFQEEAEAARERLRYEMMKMLPALRKYGRMFYYSEPDDDPQSFFHFDKENLFCDDEEENIFSRWYSRDKMRLYDYILVVDRFTQLYHTGTITINGESFKIDDVKTINWGKYEAEVVLTSSKSVLAKTLSEYFFLKHVFGRVTVRCKLVNDRLD